MPIKVLMLAIVLLCLHPDFSSASGVYVPAATGRKLSFAFELDYTARRRIIQRDILGEFAADARLTKHVIVISYSPKDYISTFIKAGLVKTKIDEFNNFSPAADLIYEGGLSAYIYPLPRDGKLVLSTGVSYFTTAETHSTDAGFEKEEIVWFEHETMLAAEYEFKRIIPFAGITFSRINGKDKLSESGNFDFSAQKSFGITCGLKNKSPYTLTLQIFALNKTEIALTVSSAF